MRYIESFYFYGTYITFIFVATYYLFNKKERKVIMQITY